MNTFESLKFSNGFAQLGEKFFARVKPTPLRDNYLIHANLSVAEQLNLNPAEFDRDDCAQILSGETLLDGAEPLAMLYAGHQFGHFVPQLGDGRAIMLGEIEGIDNSRFELQLKGAGLTPFSRDGDGRAVLRSTIREYLCSAAMEGLGIPTTRALCMTGSQQEVYREQIETGATLCRVAESHVRFGSFEVFFHRHQYDELKILADYVIDQHYPELKDNITEPKDIYLELLKAVITKTAKLMVQWQLVGFAHGVMNTDNMSVLGLTMDYGPFAFLDTYEPGFICNHSDYQGRYAFDQQPQIGLWNLTCFAQALLPLIDMEDGERAAKLANEALQNYEPVLINHYAAGMRKKLGLHSALEIDRTLSADLLALMDQNQVDYTNAFRALSQIKLADKSEDSVLKDLFLERDSVDQWLERYRQRLLQEDTVSDEQRWTLMNQVNPKYILRNHMAQKAIEMAETGDFSEIDCLMTILASPFEELDQFAEYAKPPADDLNRVIVSCSS